MRFYIGDLLSSWITSITTGSYLQIWSSSTSYGLYQVSSFTNDLVNSWYQIGLSYITGLGSMIPGNIYHISFSKIGDSGTSGSSGSSGSSGTKGSSGSSGSSGSTGTSGSSGTGFNTILQPANFRILTATGSSTNQAVAQPNLTFDGTTLTLTGNLSITGTSSTVYSQNLFVQDPIILLAGTQSGTPILDSGFMINRGTGATQAFIWDESADEFAIIQTNDNSSVIGNVNISSYANLQTGLLKSTGATFGQVKITSGAASGYVLVSDSTGLASWTSSTLNGVTGSGVTNYVPYWKSSTSLSSTSSIYINPSSGDVGIGTATPSQKLDVNGSITTNDTLRITKGASDTIQLGSSVYLLGNTGSSYTQLQQGVGRFTIWGWNGVEWGEKLTINSTTGNVGIGVTGPSAKLHVSGSQSGPLIIASGSTTDDLVRITQTGTGNSFVVEDGTNPDTTQFVINNVGDVGIGTTQSDARLNVQATAISGSEEVARFFVSDDTGSYLRIKNATSEPSSFRPSLEGKQSTDKEALYIIGNATTDTGSLPITAFESRIGGSSVLTRPLFQWNNFTSPVMTISSTGNVSIGTTYAYGRLSIMGTNSVVYSSTASYGLSDNSNNGVVTTIYNLSQATGSYAGIKFITRSNNAKKWGIYNVSKGAGSADLTFGHGDSDVNGSEVMRLTDGNNVGIGVTVPVAKLHVLGGTSSPVFKVDGTSGELFTINDSLVGSLFSVNDISGLPILEVFDDNSVIIGDYQAPSLYTTKKVITSSNGINNIYSFATASWSSAYVDYNISNAGNYRAGTLVAVFGPAGVEFTEISTLDIGNTTTGAYSLTFSFVLSGTYSILRSVTSTTNWNIKTIIRSI